MKIETCQALGMLERADVLSVNGNLIHNWNLDTFDCDDLDVVFDCSFTDGDNGYVYEFAFWKKAILDATVTGNTISMVDDTGETVEVSCYKLTQSF